MVFVRLFGSGMNTASRDPRDKIFAEYKCNVCGHIENKDVTSIIQTHDFERMRVCPSCHSIGEEDYISNLESKIERLTEERSHIDVEIDKLCREIEEHRENVEKK